MSKKKVLIIAESSVTNSGYAVITRELLTCLHEMGKYELAELGTYCRPEDDRIGYFPWKVYPTMPVQGNAEGWHQYNTRPEGQFGAWCFEQVLIDFKPDVVISYADPYMMTYQQTSPLRQYYSHLFMPTIDATPQTDEWANQYTMSDGILSYSEFGKEVLEKTCGKSINYMGVASPGANFDDMQILDKEKIRAKYGLPKDILILGMTARNQIRKGFPDLFEAFRLFIDKAPKELADKTFLHVHTGHPDAGWDMTKLLKENGLSHKVYFTYVCRACGEVRINIWNDYGLPCRRCGNRAVCLTHPAFGVNRKTLCEIYNLYNLYIQYAFLEGFGIPIVEAASCGVPVAVVPYSAMRDFVTTLEAFPIPIAKMITETQSHRKWAHPDNLRFANDLIEILNRDLKTWGLKTYDLCKKHYDWKDSAKIWAKAIDNLPLAKRKWNDPPRKDLNEEPIPDNLDDSAFIKACFKNLGHSEHFGRGFYYHIFLKNLYSGFIPNSNNNGIPGTFGRNNIIDECKAMGQAVRHWEALRCESCT